jgi:hypothetical protein
MLNHCITFAQEKMGQTDFIFQQKVGICYTFMKKFGFVEIP